MMELMNVHTGHPAAVYDPRWLGYVDLPEGKAADTEGQTLINQIFGYYQEALFSTPRALDFLHKLGISDSKLLWQWGVGFSDRTLGKQLPSGDTRDGARLRGALQRMGLSVPSGGEFFRGALVFPNTNDHGEITEAYGERITPKLRSGTPYHLYWSLESSCFFNQQALEKHRSIYLCDNPLEAMILDAYGCPNVVAMLGLRSFDEKHLETLAGNRVLRVTTAFGNTPEGDRVSRLVSQALSLYGIECHRLIPPPGMDLKAYVLANGPDALQSLIRGSRLCNQTYSGLWRDGLC